MNSVIRKAIPVMGFAVLALTTLPAVAGDDHAHDNKPESMEQSSHVHGVAALNIALDGSELHIEMDSPAANIVGFEHAPKSDADHAALDKAVVLLKGGGQLFEFGSEVGCELELAQVNSSLLDESHEHDADHAKKDDHKHGDKHGDKHSHKEEHKHTEKHAHGNKKKHADHDHDHAKADTHSDIRALYHFECKDPGKLQQLTVKLFEKLPRMEKLNVQYVVGSKQGAAQLSASKTVVEF
ncbi:MAG: DUF2796 domain-containing protein [Burkholderiaceae bacterium]